MIKRMFVVLGMMAVIVVATSAVFAKQITVRGKLQKTVEAGGWLIVTDKQKYLILNSQKFKNEKWFKEGAEVEATGVTKNVMTIYMEGTPFEVRSMRPFRAKRVKTVRNESATNSTLFAYQQITAALPFVLPFAPFPSSPLSSEHA